MEAPHPFRTVVFDIDGTLLDSADGILAGFQRALTAGAVPVPEPAELRGHLGPTLREFLTTAGVVPELLEPAAQAYHDFYLAEGLHRATPYSGVEALLTSLRATGITLATASAKLTTTARAILAAHRLAPYFTVIGGTDEHRSTKAQTLAAVLTELGADPAATIMVGDRRHDVDELTAAGADWLADDVADLGRLLGVRVVSAPGL